jgi:hypothetical protein
MTRDRFRAWIALPVALMLGAAGPPALPEAPALTMRDHHDLRCAAAFAVVASAQSGGNAAALALPPVGIRGKRYLGEVGERVAGTAGLSGPALRDVLAAEAKALGPGGALAVARSCLGDLDAAVPPRPAPDALTCLALLGVYADVLATREGQGALAAALARQAAQLAGAARGMLAARGIDAAGQDAQIAQARARLRAAITSGSGEVDADDFAQCRRLAAAAAG